MTSDPAAFHRALVAGVGGGRAARLPVPAAAVTVLAAEAMLGMLGARAADRAAWVVLLLVGGLGVVLVGLRHLPEPRAMRRGLAPRGLAAAGTVLERALLLAAAVSLAAEFLGLAVPALRPWGTALALTLTAAVLAAHVAAPHAGRRRVVAGAGWCGAAVVAVLIAAAIAGLAAGGPPQGPDPRTAATGGGVLAVLAAGALGGALLRPALPGPARPVTGGRGTARVVVAGAGVLAVLASVAAGIPVGGRDPALAGVAAAGAPDALVRSGAAVLAVVLLVAAVTSLTGPRLLALPAGPSARPGEHAAAAVLALVAAAAVALAAADVTTLVACYAAVVLVLTVLTLTTGRRLWGRALDTLYQPAARRRARVGRVATGVGAAVAGVLLLVVAVRGWPVVPALALGSAMMWGVSRHDRELADALSHVGEDRPLPTAVRAFVVVRAVDRPAVRAVTYARALRATSLEALTVPDGEQEAAGRREEWAALDLPVPLVELAAPPGHAATAVVEHVAAARRAEPTGLAVVYLPEVTARSLWRRLLLGRQTARLRARLLALPGTVVTTVPWRLEESTP